MEDDKLAEYYDDLTRRGSGAARFKQGLGFSTDAASSGNDRGPPSRGSALPTTSSFLSSFVRASSPSKASEFEKQARLQSIQDKLGKKPLEKTVSSRSENHSSDRSTYKHRSRRSRSRERKSRRRSRSLSRERRSRDRGKYRSRSRSTDRNKEKPRQRDPHEDMKHRNQKVRGRGGGGGGATDYAKSIEGYCSMTPAERVKAKMKLQLSQTAENDDMLGKGSGWERFDFDKDAPLEDEEVEAAEDDATVVKHLGQSFRFSAIEAKREQQIKNVHEEAIFGGASFPHAAETGRENDSNREEEEEEKNTPSMSSLLSDQIVSMKKQGSWRDRIREI